LAYAQWGYPSVLTHAAGNGIKAAQQMSVVTSGVRANSYSNATILLTMTSGSAWIVAWCQTANNASNDPASHLVVQAQ